MRWRGGGERRCRGLHPRPPVATASVPRPSGAGSTSPSLMEDESVHRAPSPPTAKHCHLHPAGCQIRPPQGHGTQIRPPSVVSFIPVLWPPPPVTGRHICQPLGVVSSIPGNRLPLPTTASSELLGITVPFFLASGRRGHQGFFKCFI